MKHLPLLGLVLAAACGGGGSDGGGEFTVAAEAFVGIYSLDEYTLNEAACSPGGESIAGQDTFAVAFTERFFGIDLLTVMSCADPQDCRDKVADRNGFAIDFSFTVEDVGNDGELVGGGGSTGFGMNGTCTEGSIHDTVLTLTGDQLRIEKSITLADDYPADDEGFCTTDLAREAAAANSCSSMEVLTATFVEDL